MPVAATPTRIPLVLVANAQEWVSRSLESILRPAGYAVLKAYTGSDALEGARRATADVLIFDTALPDTDVLALCRALRVDPAITPSTPIFLTMSGPLGRTQVLDALRAGANGVWGQPLDTEEFLLRLEGPVRAKLDADAARAGGLLDPRTGLYNARGLVSCSRPRRTGRRSSSPWRGRSVPPPGPRTPSADWVTTSSPCSPRTRTATARSSCFVACWARSTDWERESEAEARCRRCGCAQGTRRAPGSGARRSIPPCCWGARCTPSARWKKRAAPRAPSGRSWADPRRSSSAGSVRGSLASPVPRAITHQRVVSEPDSRPASGRPSRLVTHLLQASGAQIARRTRWPTGLPVASPSRDTPVRAMFLTASGVTRFTHVRCVRLREPRRRTLRAGSSRCRSLRRDRWPCRARGQ